MTEFALPTNIKLILGKALARGACLFEAARGRNPNKLRVVRNNINWELDLLEGIDLAIYIFGAFESDTQKFLRNEIRPGSNVLDIGANRGALALPLAQMVGATGLVFAFEPTVWAVERLSTSLTLNPELAKRIRLIPFALSNRDHAPNDIYASWNLGDVEGKNPSHGGILKKTTGHITTLDNVCDKEKMTRIDLVKLDVDGFEVEVLKSGVETLKRFKPVLLLEICEGALVEVGYSLQALLDALKECGYARMSTPAGKTLELSLAGIKSYIPKGGARNVVLHAN